MGGTHFWRPESRARIADDIRPEMGHYLELALSDDEEAVRVWWDDRRVFTPDFVVAPSESDSRTNTVIASNIRRMLPEDTLIAVMAHGKKKRERVDMIHWLIENDYLPMFPRYMVNYASPSIPLTRLQLIHEARPILDREPGQLFVAHNWHGDKEQPALDYMESTDCCWEILEQ